MASFEKYLEQEKIFSLGWDTPLNPETNPVLDLNEPGSMSDFRVGSNGVSFYPWSRGPYIEGSAVLPDGNPNNHDWGERTIFIHIPVQAFKEITGYSDRTFANLTVTLSQNAGSNPITVDGRLQKVNAFFHGETTIEGIKYWRYSFFIIHGTVTPSVNSLEIPYDGYNGYLGIHLTSEPGNLESVLKSVNAQSIPMKIYSVLNKSSKAGFYGGQIVEAKTGPIELVRIVETGERLTPGNVRAKRAPGNLGNNATFEFTVSTVNLGTLTNVSVVDRGDGYKVGDRFNVDEIETTYGYPVPGVIEVTKLYEANKVLPPAEEDSEAPEQPALNGIIGGGEYSKQAEPDCGGGHINDTEYARAYYFRFGIDVNDTRTYPPNQVPVDKRAARGFPVPGGDLAGLLDENGKPIATPMSLTPGMQSGKACGGGSGGGATSSPNPPAGQPPTSKPPKPKTPKTNYPGITGGIGFGDPTDCGPAKGLRELAEKIKEFDDAFDDLLDSVLFGVSDLFDALEGLVENEINSLKDKLLSMIPDAVKEKAENLEGGLKEALDLVDKIAAGGNEALAAAAKMQQLGKKWGGIIDSLGGFELSGNPIRDFDQLLGLASSLLGQGATDIAALCKLLPNVNEDPSGELIIKSTGITFPEVDAKAILKGYKLPPLPEPVFTIDIGARIGEAEQRFENFEPPKIYKGPRG